MEGTGEIKSIFWLGTLIMLFLAFGLLFMAVFYQRHFAKMKQKEAELLLKTALESEKKERQRIAKDLHDSVQGDISAIRNYFTLFAIKVTNNETRDLIETIKGALEQTVENTRLISYKLMPPLIETSGFSAAITNHFEKLTHSTGKRFSLQSDSPDLVIPSEIAYELFRIVQEFTQNMLKYGSISECILLLNENEKEISIEIIDDGIKFDFKASYNESKGLGLQNIQSRLKSINTKLIQQEVVKGNHFIINLNKKND